MAINDSVWNFLTPSSFAFSVLRITHSLAVDPRRPDSLPILVLRLFLVFWNRVLKAASRMRSIRDCKELVVAAVQKRKRLVIIERMDDL